MATIQAARAQAGSTDAFEIAGVFSLALLPEAACFSLRIDPTFVAQASDAFGAAIPAVMGGTAQSGERRAVCVGPDEWVLTATEADAPAIETSFAILAQERALSLVDISDRDRTLLIEGDRAIYALKAACPHDVDAMAVGTATRTLFDQADVTIVKEGPSRFRIRVLRSWSPHVVSLLKTIAQEIAAGL